MCSFYAGVGMSLPAVFELDNDGQKLEWRERFCERWKQLVSQRNRDFVKGSWDSDSSRRAMVKLPPLKPDSLRRPCYFFRPYSAAQLKLKQTADKLMLLEKKEGQLDKAKSELAELKDEYDIILREMRDASFVAFYGSEKLNSAKQIAKTEHTTAVGKYNCLARDVDNLKKVISQMPLTKAQLVTNMDDTTRFLAASGVEWSSSTELTEILGCYSPDPVIKRVERNAAKCISSDEEAQLRRQELTCIKKKDTVDQQPQEQTTTVIEEICVLHISEDSDGAKDCSTKIIEHDKSFQTVTPAKHSRRFSVLQSANPDMLNCLNQMLGGKNSRASVMSPAQRRCSTASHTPIAQATAAVSLTPAVIPAANTRSKTLQVTMVLLFIFFIIQDFNIRLLAVDRSRHTKGSCSSG